MHAARAFFRSASRSTLAQLLFDTSLVRVSLPQSLSCFSTCPLSGCPTLAQLLFDMSVARLYTSLRLAQGVSLATLFAAADADKPSSSAVLKEWTMGREQQRDVCILNLGISVHSIKRGRQDKGCPRQTVNGHPCDPVGMHISRVRYRDPVTNLILSRSASSLSSAVIASSPFPSAPSTTSVISPCSQQDVLVSAAVRVVREALYLARVRISWLFHFALFRCQSPHLFRCTVASGRPPWPHPAPPSSTTPHANSQSVACHQADLNANPR